MSNIKDLRQYVQEIYKEGQRHYVSDCGLFDSLERVQVDCIKLYAIIVHETGFRPEQRIYFGSSLGIRDIEKRLTKTGVTKEIIDKYRLYNVDKVVNPKTFKTVVASYSRKFRELFGDFDLLLKYRLSDEDLDNLLMMRINMQKYIEEYEKSLNYEIDCSFMVIKKDSKPVKTKCTQSQLLEPEVATPAKIEQTETKSDTESDEPVFSRNELKAIVKVYLALTELPNGKELSDNLLDSVQPKLATGNK